MVWYGDEYASEMGLKPPMETEQTQTATVKEPQVIGLPTPLPLSASVKEIMDKFTGMAEKYKVHV